MKAAVTAYNAVLTTEMNKLGLDMNDSAFGVAAAGALAATAAFLF